MFKDVRKIIKNAKPNISHYLRFAHLFEVLVMV